MPIFGIGGAAQIQVVRGGLMAARFAVASSGTDEVLLHEALDRELCGAARESRSLVQHAPVTRRDPLADLAQGNVIAGFLEAERATHNVEQHFEFRAGEVRKDVDSHDKAE